MHQVSFSAFAASRVAPVVPALPVRVGDPLKMSHDPSVLLLRDDEWFGEAFGYVLDATRYLPTGGHDSTELPDSGCTYVCGHSVRWH